MKRIIPVLVIIMAFLTGCNFRVETTYDHHADFRKYKTFCWMKGCEFTYTGPAYLGDTTVRTYFKNAIISEMAKRGITYNSDYPDLLVDVHVTVENKTEVVFHRNQDAQMSILPLAEPEVIEFLKGTLVMDIADKAEGRMIWRSVAMSYMDLHPEVTEKNIRRGIARMLREFPPPPDAASTAIAK